MALNGLYFQVTCFLNYFYCYYNRVSLVAQTVKNLPAVQTWV